MVKLLKFKYHKLLHKCRNNFVSILGSCILVLQGDLMIIYRVKINVLYYFKFKLHDFKFHTFIGVFCIMCYVKEGVIYVFMVSDSVLYGCRPPRVSLKFMQHSYSATAVHLLCSRPNSDICRSIWQLLHKSLPQTFIEINNYNDKCC